MWYYFKRIGEFLYIYGFESKIMTGMILYGDPESKVIQLAEGDSFDKKGRTQATYALYQFIKNHSDREEGMIAYG